MNLSFAGIAALQARFALPYGQLRVDESQSGKSRLPVQWHQMGVGVVMS